MSVRSQLLKRLTSSFPLSNGTKETPELVEMKLRSISQLCIRHPQSKDVLRQANGIDILVKQLLNTTHPSTMDSLLATLGCCVEGNSFNQKCLTNLSVFKFIHISLFNKNLSLSTTLKSAYLLSVIMDQNSQAQALAKKSGLLADLLMLSESIFPSVFGDRGVDQERLILWQLITCTIAASVNNPQNEENQSFTSTLFPFLLGLLGEDGHGEAIQSASLVLANSLSNHKTNQRLFVSHHSGMAKLKSRIQRERSRDNLVAVMSVIDAAVVGNRESVKKVVSEGLFALILDFVVKVDPKDAPMASKMLLTLCHCLDSFRGTQRVHADRDELSSKLELLKRSSDDEDLKSIVHYFSVLGPRYLRDSNKENLPPGGSRGVLPSNDGSHAPTSNSLTSSRSNSTNIRMSQHETRYHTDALAVRRKINIERRPLQTNHLKSSNERDNRFEISMPVTRSTNFPPKFDDGTFGPPPRRPLTNQSVQTEEVDGFRVHQDMIPVLHSDDLINKRSTSPYNLFKPPPSSVHSKLSLDKSTCVYLTKSNYSDEEEDIDILL